MAEREYPLVTIVRSSDGVTGTALCPYCAEIHTHGWPTAKSFTTPEHRTAHCIQQTSASERGYLLVSKERANA